MQPYLPGPRRRNLRKTRRGLPTGRRATHPVITTYGHTQRARDWNAAWAAARNTRTSQQEEAQGSCQNSPPISS